MRVYLTKLFQRDAKDVGISDDGCQDAIWKAEKGLVDANLGGGIIKQRIATGNRGAAKGSRAIVFYKRAEVAIFLHIFAKKPKRICRSLSWRHISAQPKNSKSLARKNSAHWSPHMDGEN